MSLLLIRALSLAADTDIAGDQMTNSSPFVFNMIHVVEFLSEAYTTCSLYQQDTRSLAIGRTFTNLGTHKDSYHPALVVYHPTITRSERLLYSTTFHHSIRSPFWTLQPAYTLSQLRNHTMHRSQPCRQRFRTTILPFSPSHSNVSFSYTSRNLPPIPSPSVVTANRQITLTDPPPHSLDQVLNSPQTTTAIHHLPLAYSKPSASLMLISRSIQLN